MRNAYREKKNPEINPVTTLLGASTQLSVVGTRNAAVNSRMWGAGSLSARSKDLCGKPAVTVHHQELAPPEIEFELY